VRGIFLWNLLIGVLSVPDLIIPTLSGKAICLHVRPFWWMDFVVAVLVLAILVCGRFGFSVWPFWSDLWPFLLWPFCFVAVLDVILAYPVKQDLFPLASMHSRHWGSSPFLLPPPSPSLSLTLNPAIGVWRSAVSSPSGSGRSPATKRILVHLEVKQWSVSGDRFIVFLTDRTYRYCYRLVLRQH